MNRCLLVFLVLIFAGGCGSLFPKLDAPGKKLPSGITYKNAPKAEDYPDYNKVILYESFERDVDYVPSVGIQSYHTTHVVWKVFRDVDSFSTVFDSFPEDAKIESFYARTISEDGEETVVDKTDFFIKQTQRKSSDHDHVSRSIRFSFPALKKNSIVEYKYTVILEGSNLNDEWSIQSPYPKLESHMKIKIPRWMLEEKHLGWRWQYKIYNYKDFVEDEPKWGFGDSGDVEHNWHAKNIPPYRSEPYSGRSVKNRGYLRYKINGYGSWKKTSRRYYKYFIGNKLKSNNKVKAKALELTKGLKTEEEKIKAIYYFVRKFSYDKYHLRYGHGVIPNKPELILERGYGDCKDQSILIVAMLRELGIKAFPAVIEAGADWSLDVKFHADYFNHQIVYIKTEDGKDVWLDPTFSTCPYGVVSSFCSDRYALILAKKGKLKKVLVKTPPVNTDVTGKEEFFLNFEILKDKTVKSSIKVKSHGEYAGDRMWAFVELKSDKKKKEYLRNEMKSKYFNGKTREKGKVYNYKYNDPEAKTGDYEFSFDADIQLMKNKNDDYYFDYFPLNHEYADGGGFIANLNRSGDERKTDIIWPSLFKKEIHINIKYPDNISVKSLPKNLTINLKEGDLTFSVVLKDNASGLISGKVIFSRDKKVVPKEAYSKLRKFYSDIAAVLTRNIVFEEKTVSVEVEETAEKDGGAL